MSGKGSTPRPIPDRKRYESEWDRIFQHGHVLEADHAKLMKRKRGTSMIALQRLYWVIGTDRIQCNDVRLIWYGNPRIGWIRQV